MPTSPYLENAALIRRIQSSDDPAAAEVLLSLNAGLVRQLAGKYLFLAGSLEYDDLLIEAQLGLLHAARRFDLTRGTQFSTYASPWIRQHILRAIELGGNMVRTPEHAQEKRRRAGKEPITFVLSLDEPAGDGDDCLGDLLPTFTCDPAALATNRSFIAAGLALLTAREREVIRRRYGLDGFHRETLADTATAMRMSREGVRQAEARALRRLQEWSGGTRPGKVPPITSSEGSLAGPRSTLGSRPALGRSLLGEA